jgi:scyllo-inositol 2-dehydrogenase (NADP+)
MPREHKSLRLRVSNLLSYKFPNQNARDIFSQCNFFSNPKMLAGTTSGNRAKQFWATLCNSTAVAMPGCTVSWVSFSPEEVEMERRTLFLIASLLCWAAGAHSQTTKTRLAVVGLDHDHVWGLLDDIAKEPDAELIAIADPHPELVDRARKLVPASVKFYDDTVKMLDEAKPEAVIVATENDKHLEILRACAKRHIHFSTEKPMASTAADAREMARLARESKIKLMVNYFNVWTPATHELFHRVYAGDLGPINKIVVQVGHQGPKEIGVSKYFVDWLYDPVKNGGGALVDFGCYGAEWALWLKGRPTSVFATTLKLKTDQHNAVDDDATILLEYPDATVVIQASWDWPFGQGEVAVFGPKGSLVETGESLLFRAANLQSLPAHPEGEPVALAPVAPETSNPIAYFVWCIRNNHEIENPLAADLNVGVNEILDAAKESIKTGRAVHLEP